MFKRGKFFLFLLFTIVVNTFSQRPQIVFPYEGHKSNIQTARFSNDGKRLYSQSEDGDVKMWDLPSGRLIKTFYGSKQVIGPAFFNISPNGKIIYLSGYEPKLVRLNTGERLATLDAKYQQLNGNEKDDKHGEGDFSPNGRRIVTLSKNYQLRSYTAKIWFVQKGSLLFVLQGHTQPLTTAKYSPDGTKIVTASEDSTAKIWDAYTGKLLLTLDKQQASITQAVFSPDNQKIITVSEDDQITIWNADDGLSLAKIKVHTSKINSITFNPDGNKLISCSYDGSAKIWDIATGQMLKEFKQNDWVIYTAEISPDGKKLVSASGDGAMRVWDVATAKLIFEKFNTTSFNENFAFFSPDGKTIATPSDDKGIAIWDYLNQKLVADITEPCITPYDAKFSQDGKSIIAACKDGTVKVWDVKQGLIKQNFKNHKDAVYHIALNPEKSQNNKVVTLSWDSTARIWDITTGKELLKLRVKSTRFEFASFNKNGKLLVTATKDTSVQLWDATTGKQIASKKMQGDIYKVDFDVMNSSLINIATNYTTLFWNFRNNTFITSAKRANYYSGVTYNDLIFNSDGSKVVVMSGYKYNVWDCKADKMLYSLSSYWGYRQALFSPDKKSLVVFSEYDKTFIAYDITTGREIFKLNGKHQGNIYTIHYSPDGKYIVTASADNRIKLWDATNGDLKYTLCLVGQTDFLIVDDEERYDGTEKARALVHFSCDNKIVDAVSFKNISWEHELVSKLMGINKDSIKATIPRTIENCANIKSTPVNKTNIKLVLPIGHTWGLNTAKFSPDGKKVVTTSYDKTAKVWDAETGKQLANFNQSEDVKNAYFLNNGKDLLIGSNDATLYNIQSGEFIKSFGKAGKSLILSVDGKKMLALSLSEIRYSDLDSGLLFNKDDYGYRSIKNAAISPDNSTIAVLDDKGEISIYNTQTRVLKIIIKDFKFYRYDFYTPVFSADSKWLITGGTDTVKIWDAQTGNRVKNFIGHTGEINSIGLSEDGRKIVTAADDSTIKVWDINTGKLLLDLNNNCEKVNYASFSPDGTKIISLCRFGKVGKVWDASTGQLLFSLIGHSYEIKSIEFSKNGNKILTASSDKTAKIWDAGTGRLLQELKGHTQYIKSAVFSPDGKKIVHNSSNDLTRVWDITTGVLEKKISGKITPENNHVFTPDAKNIITVDSNYNSVVWSFDSSKLLMNLNKEKYYISSSVFSPDGKTVVTTSSYQKPIIWDASTGKPIAEIAYSKDYSKVVFSPNSQLVVTYAIGGGAKVWNVKTGLLVAEFSKPNETFQTIAFSSDSKLIVGASYSSAIVWDAETGKIIKELKDGWSMKSALYTPDGKKIITLSYNNTKIWDAKTFEHLDDLDDKDVEFIVCSPDGKTVVTAGKYAPTIWSLKNGERLFDYWGRNVNSMAFSPDSKSFVTTSEDNTAKLWSTQTGKLLYSFFAVDSTDYLVVDAENRYDGTPNARKLLYFTCDDEVIELDQVKDQLWVPGLAERIMKGETINAKTLNELNICGLVPLVEEKANTNNQYQFQITPRRGGLGETVLYVNGIEAKRYQSQQLQQKGSNYELNVSANELAAFMVGGQQNNVTVKAYTKDNTISSRGATLLAKNDDTKTTAIPNLYAVMVGINDYKGTELDLKYAAKDATDLSNALGYSARKLLNTDGEEHVFIYNLTTAENRYQLPEKNSIKKVIEDIGKKATANDILLLFFAGHGVTGSNSNNDKQFYFLTADASKSSAVDAMADVGISTAELSDWIKPQNLKAQKRILIFDACNSGQAIKDFVNLGQQGQNYIAARDDDKARQIKAIDKLNEKSGLFILSASASNQVAYEMGRYSQGMLTYALLSTIKQQPDILQDGKYLDVSRWFGAAEKMVTDLAKDNGARQQPQVISTTNFTIGLVDDEIRAKIVLPMEKPLFTSSNIQNDNPDIAYDDKALSKLVDQQLFDIASRGTNTAIVYTPNVQLEEAWIVSGRYEVIGTTIKARINIRQGKSAPKHRLEITGTTDKLDILAREIVQQVTKLVQAGEVGK